MLTMLDLPQDIFIHVVAFLDIQDLSRIARTCHGLHRCSCDDYIWKYMYTLEYGTCTIKEQEISSWKEKCAFRRKARATDVESFNSTPTYLPGMNELEEGGTPQYKMEKYAVKFLQDPRITRVARGVYLSITDKRTHGVLDSYFETLDFGGQSVLESLTYLLQFIQFPPHFSVITKFMLAFAQRYYTCNSNSIFRNFDAVYVLAFGIIMLNTDMHNSAVKNKMTLAQYISNCSGINGGENLPEKMLTDIYTKVKEKSLVINRTTPTSQYDSSLWSWVSDWLYKLKK